MFVSFHVFLNLLSSVPTKHVFKYSCSCNILVMICGDVFLEYLPWSTHDILCLLRVLELNHWTTQRIASQVQKQNIWAWLVSTQPELLKLWLSELLGFTKHWSVRVPSTAALTASAAVWHRFTTALHATERTPNSNRRIKKHVRLDNSNFDQSRSRILSGWIFFYVASDVLLISLSDLDCIIRVFLCCAKDCSYTYCKRGWYVFFQPMFLFYWSHVLEKVGPVCCENIRIVNKF